MPEIYSNAASVIIWLGVDPSQSAPLAMEWMQRYAKYAIGCWKSAKHSAQPEMKSFQAYSSDSSKVLLAVAEILHQEWFYRVWTLQEAALARKAIVQCGPAIMTLEDLVLFADSEHRTSRMGDRMNTVWVCNAYSQIWAAFGIADTWMERLPFEPPYVTTKDGGKFNQCLGDLMRMTLQRQTSDERDRIYSILRHPLLRTDNLKDTLVQPDYDVPIERLYQKLMVAAITKKQDLSLLSLIQYGRRNKNPFTESWIPNFRIGSNIFDFMFFAAGTKLKARASVNTSTMQLSCRGVRIGNVSCPVDAFPYSKEVKSYHEAVADFTHVIDYLMLLAPRPPSAYVNLRNLEYLACVLFPSSEPDGHSERWLHTLRDDTTLLERFWYRQSPRSEDSSTEGFSSKSSNTSQCSQQSHVDFLEEFEKLFFSCSNRRVFKMQSGFWGLGPGTMRKGDECCIINGNRVPYILRRNGDGTHCFVGECYVPGLMFGEVMHVLEDGEAHEEILILR